MVNQDLAVQADATRKTRPLAELIKDRMVYQDSMAQLRKLLYRVDEEILARMKELDADTMVDGRFTITRVPTNKYDENLLIPLREELPEAVVNDVYTAPRKEMVEFPAEWNKRKFKGLRKLGKSVRRILDNATSTTYKVKVKEDTDEAK